MSGQSEVKPPYVRFTQIAAVREWDDTPTVFALDRSGRVWKWNVKAKVGDRRWDLIAPPYEEDPNASR